MQKLVITVGRSDYSIACEKGQEERLKNLGEKLNARYNSFLEAFPHASDNVLLVMTALMLEDSLDDLSSKKEPTPEALLPENNVCEKEITTHIDAMAENIEKLAKSIKFG